MFFNHTIVKTAGIKMKSTLMGVTGLCSSEASFLSALQIFMIRQTDGKVNQHICIHVLCCSEFFQLIASRLIGGDRLLFGKID